MDNPELWSVPLPAESVEKLRPGWQWAITALKNATALRLERKEISPRDARGYREAADWLDSHWPHTS